MEVKITEKNNTIATTQDISPEAAVNDVLENLEHKIYPAVLHRGEHIVTVIEYGDGLWYQAWHEGELVGSGNRLGFARVRLNMEEIWEDSDADEENYPSEFMSVCILDRIQQKIPGVNLFDYDSCDYERNEKAMELVWNILDDGGFFDIAEEVYNFNR